MFFIAIFLFRDNSLSDSFSFSPQSEINYPAQSYMLDGVSIDRGWGWEFNINIQLISFVWNFFKVSITMAESFISNGFRFTMHSNATVC